jgi:hypothetical protein
MLKLHLTTEYQSGESETFVILPPEWAKWEKHTGFTIQQVQEKLGVSDLLFLAWNCSKREAAGKPVKPFDAWCDTVANIEMGDVEDPKATSSEV